MITVVFSALWGGSDGSDGWFAVWPTLCLDIRDGAEGEGERLVGDGWW